MVSLLAFVNLSFLPSGNKPPLWFKYAIVGGFCIPGVVALVIGLVVSRFRYWKRDVGIVFVSGAGTTVKSSDKWRVTSDEQAAAKADL
jgi:hypothetical protein